MIIRIDVTVIFEDDHNQYCGRLRTFRGTSWEDVCSKIEAYKAQHPEQFKTLPTKEELRDKKRYITVPKRTSSGTIPAVKPPQPKVPFIKRPGMYSIKKDKK